MNNLAKSIPLVEVESNMMTAVGYDEQSQTLAIAWKPKKNSLRTVEHYQSISKELFDSFMAAPSKGQFWIASLRRLPKTSVGEIE